MFKERSLPVKKADEMSPQEIGDKIVVGEFIDTVKPALCAEIAALKERVRKKG